MKYIDEKMGRLIFVRSGIGGDVYKAMYQDKSKWGSGGAHALKSPDLPWRYSQEDAQRDLDKYAVKKNLKVYKEGNILNSIDEVQKCEYNGKKCPYYCGHNGGCTLKLVKGNVKNNILKNFGEYDCEVYRQYDPKYQAMEIKRPLEVIEAEINFYKTQTASGIIEIGKRLIEAKELIQHGEWGKWLEEKVEVSQWTANKFMRVANELSNCGTFNNLPQSKVFMLLDVPADKRQDFIENNPVDEMTTRELRQAIKGKKDLEKKLEEKEQKIKELETMSPKVIEKVVEVVPTNIKRELEDKELEIDNLKAAKELLEKKVKLNEDESKKYNDLKKQIEYLYQQKSDLARQVESATELSGLAVKIDHFLKTELAPIKYSRVFERMDSEVARENILDIIDKVDQWSFDMRQMIPKEYRRMEVYHE